jgi:hypothetical protein
MPRLAPRPVDVQMQFVLPDVKKGDYYNVCNPITGRQMYVYPFMMGPEPGKRYYPSASGAFPAVDRLGDNGDPEVTAASLTSWLASRPQEWFASVQQTQQDVREAQQWMKIALAASLVASGLVVWMAFFKKD